MTELDKISNRPDHRLNRIAEVGIDQIQLDGTFTKEQLLELANVMETLEGNPVVYTEEMAAEDDELLAQLGGITPREMCDDVVFSILNVFDGCSGGFPAAIDLALAPHPEDKEYCISNGEKWVEPGQVINDDVMLHELFVKPLGK